MKYRFDVLALNERNWASNAMTYDTIEEARAAGWDLFSRWMLVEKFRVVPADAPTRERYEPAPDEDKDAVDVTKL